MHANSIILQRYPKHCSKSNLFFKDLNAEPDFESHQTINNTSTDDDDEVLNSPTTHCEISKCIKSLKTIKLVLIIK